MVMMCNLHEAPLLYLLQRRLTEGHIYTWAGDVLISLNPYAAVDNLYDVSASLNAAGGASESPHVYAISRRAYTELVRMQAMGAAAQKAS